MPRNIWTLVLATGFAASLSKFPIYAAVTFTLTIFWNHFFPATQPNAEILLLPTRKLYLATMSPLENPMVVQGEHCPACWDQLDATNAPTRLACSHVFCNEDIKDWLNSGKNTCPVCKEVLFQQAIFQGNDAIAEKIHKARVCLVAMSLLIELLNQPLAFIACNPAHLSHMRWRWNYLNPLAYLTSYGSWYKNADAIIVIAFDVTHLLCAYWGTRKYGPGWFRVFPGHWAWWILGLYAPASQIRRGIDDSRHYGWVAWRICQWRWMGSPGSFLFWRATVVPAVKRELGERAEDLVTSVMHGWNEHGEGAHAVLESWPM
jgi:hypothetical protein